MRKFFCDGVYFMALLAVSLVSASDVSAQSFNHTLYVDPIDSTAADTNVGTESDPLKTIQQAIDRAVEWKRSYQSTRIVLLPGTYREPLISFGYTNWPTNDPDNHTPILVEAKHHGTAIISGADIWTGWQADSTGWYSHDWAFD
ncbi:MAG: hypothetical protein HKN13_13390, partial [Rhodothermales bacterium]|nr:hypothetical protein [Rhodothermales bacterium]